MRAHHDDLVTDYGFMHEPKIQVRSVHNCVVSYTMDYVYVSDRTRSSTGNGPDGGPSTMEQSAAGSSTTIGGIPFTSPVSRCRIKPPLYPFRMRALQRWPSRIHLRRRAVRIRIERGRMATSRLLPRHCRLRVMTPPPTVPPRARIRLAPPIQIRPPRIRPRPTSTTSNAQERPSDIVVWSTSPRACFTCLAPAGTAKRRMERMSAKPTHSLKATVSQETVSNTTNLSSRSDAAHVGHH